MSKFFLSVIVCSIFVSQSVLAAGGGGGGSIFSESTPAPVPAPASAPIVTTTPPEPEKAPPVPVANMLTEPAPDKLRCDQATIEARVACRLSLTEDQLVHELLIQYLPEECRTMTSGKQERCIARYQSLRPCWVKPLGASRTKCAREKLGLTTSITAAMKACRRKLGSEQRACVGEVREKTYALIKFHLYDLSERAEDTRDHGVPLASIVSLVVAVEKNKQAFNQATSDVVRKKFILASRTAWQKFARASKGQETNRDYLDQALAELRETR